MGDGAGGRRARGGADREPAREGGVLSAPTQSPPVWAQPGQGPGAPWRPSPPTAPPHACLLWGAPSHPSLPRVPAPSGGVIPGATSPPRCASRVVSPCPDAEPGTVSFRTEPSKGLSHCPLPWEMGRRKSSRQTRELGPWREGRRQGHAGKKVPIPWPLNPGPHGSSKRKGMFVMTVKGQEKGAEGGQVCTCLVGALRSNRPRGAPETDPNHRRAYCGWQSFSIAPSPRAAVLGSSRRAALALVLCRGPVMLESGCVTRKQGCPLSPNTDSLVPAPLYGTWSLFLCS